MSVLPDNVPDTEWNEFPRLWAFIYTHRVYDRDNDGEPAGSHIETNVAHIVANTLPLARAAFDYKFPCSVYHYVSHHRMLGIDAIISVQAGRM